MTALSHTMGPRALRLGPFRLQATDVLILATLGLFTLLAVLFAARVQYWWRLSVANIVVAAVYIGMIHVKERANGDLARFFIRVAAVTLTYAYLFGAVDSLQLILHGQWLDAYVLDAENRLLGVQPTLWMERFVSPPLTEWMMFAYVIYVPLYPLLCGLIYRLHGATAMEDYFFTLGVTNVLCDLGFILFPVAGPMYTIRSLYTVPLTGYVWTYLGELMRSYLHYAGGTIPSPHCANATIMWIMAFRYHRPSFVVLSPIIVSLYVSTVYGRYHYVSDAVAGIATAGIGIALVPLLLKSWERLTRSRTDTAKPANAEAV